MLTILQKHTPVAAALLLLGAASAGAYEAVWTTMAGERIVTTDCRDCEEEIGILIACRDANSAAEVTVHAAASERGVDGAIAPLTFVIDGRSFTRQARTVHYGMIGFTPEFDLFADDPLIAAFESGHKAQVVFNGSKATLGLKGSREALASFKTQCGWNAALQVPGAPAQPMAAPGAPDTPPLLPIFGTGADAGAAAAPPQYIPSPPPAQAPAPGLLPVFGAAPGTASAPVPQAAPQEPPAEAGGMTQTVLRYTPAHPDGNGSFWFTGDGFGGGSPKSLRFGIPESDATALWASCERFDPAGINLEVYVSFGNLPAGAPATIVVGHGGGVSSYPGTVFADSEEYAGVRARVPSNDPLWDALATSPQVSIAVDGGEPAVIPGQDGAPALAEFSGLCRG